VTGPDRSCRARETTQTKLTSLHRRLPSAGDGRTCNLTSPHDNLARALAKLKLALAEGRVEEAVMLGEEAVGAAPRYVRAIAALVMALKRAGRDDEARRVLDEVPADLAGSPTDLLAIADLCLREGAQATAQEMLRSALEADPTREHVAELLAGMYYAEGDLAGVVAVCEPFRMRGCATPTLLRFLCAAYEKLGDLPEAIDCGRLYAEAAPLDPAGHYHLATLEHRTGNAREALERYYLALELSGGDAELEMSASEGIQALDALQLRQIASIVAADPTFRIEIDRDPQAALDERGFALSDECLAVLANLDLDAMGRGGSGGSGPLYH
jgi:tetratricopeptide (TPR) repeat protein